MNISPVSNAPTLTSPAVVKASAVAVEPSGPSQVQSDAAQTALTKTKLQAPEKVDLGFSAQEMRENIQEAIDRLNQQVKANGRDLSFQMDEKINRPIITVRNIETGEVVRQIPSEEIIRMAHSLEEGKGLLFNESL